MLMYNAINIGHGEVDKKLMTAVKTKIIKINYDQTKRSWN